jgi:hypothetical protein
VDRVQKFAQRQPPDGFDEIIRQILLFKFPLAPESLRMQLTKSIVYRRNRLMYQQSHQSKLATEREDEDATPINRPVHVETTPHPDRDHTPPPAQAEEILVHNRTAKSLVVSDTLPTIFDGHQINSNESPAQPTSSIGSGGSSDRVGDVVYPRPPTYLPDSVHAECPYCSREVSKDKVESPKWWRYVLSGFKRLPILLLF